MKRSSRRWIWCCVIGVLILLSRPVYAQRIERENLEAALSALKESSKKLEALEPTFQLIRKNQEQMLKDIEYLRIRNRKKGNVRVGGDRLARLQKIDLIQQNDPKALENLDKQIDKLVEKISRGK